MIHQVTQRHTRSSARIVALVSFSVALLLALVATSVAPAQAVSPRVSSKVTICHRTHAVTNPYRRITVNISSIITNSSNGHDATTHNPFYGDGTAEARPVFDPTFTYPNNQKQWQDIIPAFSYEQGGTTLRFPGLNWDPTTTAGQAIYYGLTVGGQNYAGLCGEQGAGKFFSSELQQWKDDNPGFIDRDLRAKKRDILDDLKDQEADGDPAPGQLNNPNYDPTDLPQKDKTPSGPKKPTEYTDLITEIQNENEGNDGSDPADPINQALAGVVWKDMNRNGIQEDDEESFDVVGIQVLDPDTGEPLTLDQLNILPVTYTHSSENQVFRFAESTAQDPVFTSALTTTITIHTVNGYFEIPSIPEGDWEIVVITPEGWSYTFDSSGGGNGLMPGTYVPLGGVGFAWAGLVYGDASASDPTLSNTGVSPIFVGAGAGAVLALLAGVLAVALRRRHHQ